MSRDLEHFSDSVDDMFSRLGLPNPEIMAVISNEWEELAGAPWKGRSRPLYIKGTTLVVEASSASMVAFLRYGEASLVDSLKTRLGQGKIDSVRVLAPGRS